MTGDRRHAGEAPAPERIAVSERPISRARAEAAAEPEWRARLRMAVERSVRQRAARAEHRRMLTARRTAGLQARQAARIARVHDRGSATP
jgi:hypothetical protein